MKRVWIVSIIILLILGVSVFSIFHLSRVTEELDASLAHLAELTNAKEDKELVKQTAAFEEQWEQDEAVMMHYIHHDELDAITGTVARLNALARYQDYSELAAEIERLRHLIRHIYESELPSWNTVF